MSVCMRLCVCALGAYVEVVSCWISEEEWVWKGFPEE